EDERRTDGSDEDQQDDAEVEGQRTALRGSCRAGGHLVEPPHRLPVHITRVNTGRYPSLEGGDRQPGPEQGETQEDRDGRDSEGQVESVPQRKMGCRFALNEGERVSGEYGIDSGRERGERNSSESQQGR